MRAQSEESPNTPRLSLWRLLPGPIFFVATLLMPAPSGFEGTSWQVLGLVGWMALWWALEAIPLAATALLKLATLGALRLGCWALLPLVTALSWPLWALRREQTMFVRRLLLTGATLETGRVRRWFWRGTVMQTLGVLPALAWAVEAILPGWLTVLAIMPPTGK